jgi:hypothetical protein
MKNIELTDDLFLIFPCPYCELMILVDKNQLNCCIFRHGVKKDNYQQTNPHACKEECDQLVKDDKVYGCNGSFEILIKNDKYYVNKCDYK